MRRLQCDERHDRDACDDALVVGQIGPGLQQVEPAVLVLADEWRRLQQAARPSPKSLLLSDQARAEPQMPPRDQARRRPTPRLG